MDLHVGHKRKITSMKMKIKKLMAVWGMLLTTRALNLENKLEGGVLEASMYLSLSQCGGSKIGRMPSLHLL